MCVEYSCVYIQILHRIPSAYLWLLDPMTGDEKTRNQNTQQTELTKQSIDLMLQMYGISVHRVMYAGRVSKHEHIRRYI